MLRPLTSIMQKITAFLLMIVISAQPACSVFSPVKITSPDNYVLTKTPSVKKRHRQHHALLVSSISSDPIYDRTQMAYSTAPYEVDYFTKSEWASLPSNMLQNLVVKTLTNTHHFRGVVTQPTYAQYDYILNLKLLEMKQVFLADHSYYEIKISAELVNVKRSTLISTKTVSITKRADDMTARAGVVAANQAVASALKQIADWCVQKT